MRYRTIVVDPPWDFGDAPRPGWTWREGRPSGADRAFDYPTLTNDEIADLPIRRLADYGAHVYLWTTNQHLRVAFDIAHAWGISEPVVLVWCKRSRGFAPGGRFQNNVEFVLHGTRPGKPRTRREDPDVLRVTTFLADAAERAGIHPRDVDKAFGTTAIARVFWFSRDAHRCSCPSVAQWMKLKALLGFGGDLDSLVESINARKGTTRREPENLTKVRQEVDSRWFQWPRGEHSAKPEAFLDLVEQVSPGPYLELFARRNRLGWDAWGNEALSHVEVTA